MDQNAEHETPAERTAAGDVTDETTDERSPPPEVETRVADTLPTLETESLREERIMKVWKQVSRLFSGLRYGWSTPKNMWFQTRRQFGDTITSSHKLKYWQKLRALTDTLDDTELDYMRALAQQRFEFAAATLRLNAVASVTLPLTAAVIANQLYPGVVQQVLEEGSVTFLILFLIAVTLVMLVFGNVFKARELRMALDVEAARRRLHHGEAGVQLTPSSDEFDFLLPLS